MNSNYLIGLLLLILVWYGDRVANHRVITLIGYNPLSNNDIRKGAGRFYLAKFSWPPLKALASKYPHLPSRPISHINALEHGIVMDGHIH